MSTAGIIVSFVIIAAVGVISVIALILAINANNGLNTMANSLQSGSGLQTVILVPNFLEIYDDRSQAMLGPNTWTSVSFNNHLFVSSSWIHDLDSDTIICNRSDLYTVYFAIEAQVNLSALPTVVPPECKACDLRYSLRGTQQIGGEGTIFEIPASLTYASGQQFLLSKSFFINASVGDVFRFQFASLCAGLVLHPQPYLTTNEPVPVPDSYPSSAVLSIS
jgi:hypothetical protein